MEDFGQKYNALASEISRFKPPTMKYKSNIYFSTSMLVIILAIIVFICVYKTI